jgi:trigger factor
VTDPEKQELDVDVEVKELDGGEVELEVRVPSGPVLKAREDALREFGRSTSIPGFRKGKVPRAILERHVDEAALRERVTDTVIEDAFDEAVKKAGLKPLGRAQLREADLSEDWQMTFSATVTLRPEIGLGDYKGLKATRYLTPVTDQQVEVEIERVRSRRSTYEDIPEGAAIETGDVAEVSYEMFVDGEEREDAGVSGYPLEVGKDDLFPELNEALPGVKVGESREIEITYQADHSDESLAGKTAQFKVVVRKARRRQMPELDDEFAQQVSDLETLEALRQRVRENLEAVGKAMADEDVANQLVRQAAEAASLDVPQALVDRETDRRIDEIEEELTRRNLTLHQHLESTNRSFDEWRADVERGAREAARRALLLDEIGDREGVEVTGEEVREEIRLLAKREKVSESAMRKRLSESNGLAGLANRLYERRTVQLLVDNAEIAEETVERKEEDEKEAAAGAPSQKDPEAEHA